MRRKITILFVVLYNLGIVSANAFDDLLFMPLVANHLEARIGSFYQFDDERLRLDIGHSLDLFEFDLSNANKNKSHQLIDKIRVGADFFILSRLRSEGRLKFPVETADYFFGVNTSSNIKLLNELFSTRLRLAHISSHLIDGYSDSSKFWKAPFIYSREFVDLVIAYNNKYLRPYIGCSYIFSTQPKSVSKFVPEFGFDFNHEMCSFLGVSGGYDLKVVGGENLSSVVSNSIQTGLDFILSKNIKLSLNYYYYSGYSIHGMFYDSKDKYSGFGFEIKY